MKKRYIKDKEEQIKVLQEIIKKANSESYKLHKHTEKEIKFKCRLCGCTKYQGAYGSSDLIPLGGKLYPFAFQCDNCSVIFKDVEKFTLSD